MFGNYPEALKPKLVNDGLPVGAVSFPLMVGGWLRVRQPKQPNYK